MKTLLRHLASSRCAAAALIVFGLAVGALAPLTAGAQSTPAQTATPSVRIGTAALLSPQTAGNYYGSSTTSSNSTGVYTSPPEVVELARALDNNVDLIYQFVRNNIDVAWMYGAQKGALGAITDRSGTPFDQAMLMVALLRQAGYTASYQVGTITLNASQFSAWTNITDAESACQLLASGSIPAVINGSTPASCGTFSGVTITSVQMGHIWVAVTIPGATACSPCLFDPSYKPFTFKSGLNLTSATGLTTGAAMTATNPAVSTTEGSPAVNYIKNLNVSGGLTTLLNGYGSNLLATINANVAHGEMEDLVGGAIIQPYSIPSGGAGLRQASLPYTGYSASATWTGGIPDQYRTVLGVEIDQFQAGYPITPIIGPLNLFVDEIYGRKLIFDTNTQPQQKPNLPFKGTLKLVDEFGTGIALAEYAPSGTYVATQATGRIILSANHPYAASSTGAQTADGTYMDVSVLKPVSFVMPFTIVHGWGDVGRGGIDEKWGTRIDSDINNIQALPDCEACLGSYYASRGDGRREQLAASWLAQSSRAARIHASIAHAIYQHHHSMGIVAADTTTYLQDFVPPQQVDSPDDYAYPFADTFDRIDVESGISLTSTTASSSAAPSARRAALFAIAATNEALEGSVIAQTAQLPDISSVATRFEWGDAPPQKYPEETSFSEDPNCTTSGTPCSRGFLEFTYNNYTALNAQNNALILEDDQITVNNTNSSDECKPSASNLGETESWLSGAISTYAINHFDVVASEESFLGPGQRCGPFIPNAPPATGYAELRAPSLQRGGALVATLYDTNGLDPLQIAHLVFGPNGQSKGGGGGAEPDHQASYDPSTAADVLKARFVDRSKVLGVDMQSGKATTTSPASLTVGNGGFPYALTAQLIWRGGDVQTTKFGPIVHTEPQTPWTTNWNNTLTVSGSGLQTMGDGELRATAGTVAAFVAMQDVYSSAPSVHREAAGALVTAWWVHQLGGNVVTVNVGADTRQFVNETPWSWKTLSAGTWLATGPGAYAQLQVTGTRQPYMNSCGDTGDYQLSRGWDESQLSFVVTNAHGDQQNFGFWDKSVDDPISGTWCAYQKGFRLNSWSFPQGVTVNLTYTAGTHTTLPDLQSVSNTLGKTITFVSSGLGGFNDGSSNIRAVAVTPDGSTHTDPAGDVSTFYSSQFGTKWLLNAIYTPDNPAATAIAPSTQYIYDSMGRVKLASDAVALQQGTRAPYQFNIAEGLRGERIDPLGARYTVYYDNRKRALQYIDELGHTTTVGYDGSKRVTSYMYPIGVQQNALNPAQVGDQELLAYDEHNNPTKLTKVPDSTSVPLQPAQIIVSAQWDQNLNKPTWIKDAMGNETDFTYYPATPVGNGASLIAQVMQPSVSNKGGSNSRPLWVYTYDPLGKLQTQTDPTGVVTQNNYDENSSNVSYGYLLNTVVDPGSTPHVASKTIYTYDTTVFPTAGNVSSVTDPDGNATSTTYDKDSRVLSAAGPTGTYMLTENTYNYGLLVKVRQGKVANPPENDTTQVSDASWAVTTHTYTSTRKPWTTVDPSGYQSVIAYDGDDRTTDATICLTAGTTGNGTCPTTSRTTHTTYYADGQVNQVFKGWGSPEQISYSTTTYDADDKPLTVADANQNITATVYDGFERPYRLCFPDSANGSCTVTGTPSDFEQFTQYDANGNVLQKQNRDGIVITSTYDTLNRETGLSVPANSDGHFARTQSTYYDLAGRKWRAGVTDTETGTTSSQYFAFQYDTAGRQTSVDDSYLAALFNSSCTPGGASRCFGSVAAGLDDVGNLTTQTLYGSGGTSSYAETYTYDPLNRLLTLSDSQAIHATYQPYTPQGHPSSATWGNTTQTAWAFQDNGDLKTLTHTFSVSSSLSWNLTPNGAHQITGETINDNTFEMQATTTGLSYNVNSLNQYSSVNGTAQTYDKNGNLTGDGTWTYQYDEESRLRTASGPHTVLYDYDPLGRRRSKTVDGVTTYYTSDGAEEVAEWNSAGTLTTRYLNGITVDDHVAMLDYGSACSTAPATPCLYYYHPDWHGSTMALTGTPTALASGNRYTYGPYGESLNGTSGNPFRYTGRRLDAETGLYYYRARYYSPALGRFLQTDPIGGKDDLNQYVYTGGDPINTDDPTGMAAGSDSICDSAGSSPCSTSAGAASVHDGQEAAARAHISNFVSQALSEISSVINTNVSTPTPNSSLASASEQTQSDIAGARTQEYLRGIGQEQDRQVLGAVQGIGQGYLFAASFFTGSGEVATAVTVTRWGREGLQAGDWVMTGEPSYWNYLRSAKWQPGMGNEFSPFRASTTVRDIPRTNVRWPAGWGVDGWIKGLFGQRIYTP